MPKYVLVKEIKTRIYTGIGSCDYGGGEVPRPAVGKLQTQESQWDEAKVL